MREITSLAKSVQGLLGNVKYHIDYYQREYRWGEKQVGELIEDLASRFLDGWKTGEPRKAVAGYGHYFLGSVIIGRKGEDQFIVDGQQRLTTLTLLLIYLGNLQCGRADPAPVDHMIFSDSCGEKTFNIREADPSNGGFDKDPFEVEHIWAVKPDRHSDEFPHPQDFADYRNHIGGLLLLQKSFNASYGALPYAEKLEHYDSQNLLARSLNAHCYEHNPKFWRFINESGLPLEPQAEFKKADLGSRQELYRQIAARMWSPDRLAEYVTEWMGKRTKVEV